MAESVYKESLAVAGGTMTGPLLLPSTAAAATALAFAANPTTGWNDGNGAGQWRFAQGGADRAMFYSGGLQLKSDYFLAFSSGLINAANDTLLRRASAGTFSTSVGTGTAVANIGGTYAKFVSAAGVGNGADLTNDPLWTLTAIPANTFTANGDALILTLQIQAGPTGNNKAWGLTVGGTQVTSNTTATNGNGGVITGIITRVDSTHVNIVLAGVVGVAPLNGASNNVVVSDLTANTLAVIVTGASPTTGAANDARLYSGTAEFKK